MFELTLPKGLSLRKNGALFTGILRGVERETLRVTAEGRIAQTPHPLVLGSALAHPQITTDFSEALLEFITPPTHEVDDLFEHLQAIHRFVAQHLGEELLWPLSMPCGLDEDSEIPVARYGSSNTGQMKTVYRVGLGHRYGRAMQTVAGIHYNFSLPNAFWAYLSRQQNRLDDLQDFKNECYFNLVRNFRRHYWLLIYLFGASPALCRSFVRNRPHQLQSLPGDEHTLYLPYATSLRMGDLGYQSRVQEALYVCYNNVDDYIKSLCCAITQSHPVYEKIGLRDSDNNYKQLNTSILQIENEFYSSIRPKRSAKYGETALAALRNRGVEYVEVRCLDVNPDSPFGITREQVRFLDVFLTYCALAPSPQTSPEEAAMMLRNQKRVVNTGRQSGLTLESASEGVVEMQQWALTLLEHMQPIATLFDSAHHCEEHQQSLEIQRGKVLDAARTPSAQQLAILQAQQLSYGEYGRQKAREHLAALRATPLAEDVARRMQDMAEESLAEQAAIESASTLNFDEYIAAYYQQYSDCRARSDSPCY